MDKTELPILKKYECDKCGERVPAYYTLSYLTKGLWVKCPTCGTHVRPYVANLNLPYKPSKSYLRYSPCSKLSNKEQTTMF